MKEIKSESCVDHSLPERLRQAFNYDPETGAITWKDGRRWGSQWWQKNTLKPGGIRGNFKVNGKYRIFGVHSVIWIMIHGEIPKGKVIDHINGDPFDNRLVNLRLATHSQNIANAADYRGKKDGLPRGVYRNGKRFQAVARKDGTPYYLGTFDTPEEAHQIYLAKARELHGEFHKHYVSSEPPRS